ncbi:MAG: phycobiliprotein lyase [Coleofasciculaceae cyanobacterium]
MDATKFFELSAGKWRSQRTTHHLPFRRSETGESEINVDSLSADHPKVIEICQLHEIDPSLAAGGALVSWQGTMAWDKTDENHQDSTVMVLVPEPSNPQKGKLLREKGYAEIVPVAGLYQMDDDDGMVLITEYETMSSEERFSFVSPDLRMRTSLVKRFGGFSTASLCIESRVDSHFNEASSLDRKSQQGEDASESGEYYSILGW